MYQLAYASRDSARHTRSLPCGHRIEARRGRQGFGARQDGPRLYSWHRDLTIVISLLTLWNYFAANDRVDLLLLKEHKPWTAAQNSSKSRWPLVRALMRN
jgi:hypothetical protein